MTLRPKQVGRLHDPETAPRNDPRIDPRLLKAMTAFGLDALAASPPLDRRASVKSIAELLVAAEGGFEGLYEALPNELPGVTNQVTTTTQTITGLDGNQVALHLTRPTKAEGPLPALLYTHGGGMTILKTLTKVHRQWCEDLAATGLVVVLIDFRNAGGAAGLNPFPAGLNDCTSALNWVHEHRGQLGVSKVVLQGESGGANLALATALKAKREGRIAAIDGVYAMVPYISGGYGWSDERKAAELPSLLENDSYFINCAMMDLLVALYDPQRAHAEDPLAWPYFASENELAGLPPHTISVNELDPLRDEGMAYYRKLGRAGVTVTGRMNLGLVHAADTIFRQAIPEVYFATVRDIKRFVDRLPNR